MPLILSINFIALAPRNQYNKNATPERVFNIVSEWSQSTKKGETNLQINGRWVKTLSTLHLSGHIRQHVPGILWWLTKVKSRYFSLVYMLHLTLSHIIHWLITTGRHSISSHHTTLSCGRWSWYAIPLIRCRSHSKPAAIDIFDPCDRIRRASPRHYHSIDSGSKKEERWTCAAISPHSHSLAA